MSKKEYIIEYKVNVIPQQDPFKLLQNSIFMILSVRKVYFDFLGLV